MTTTTIPQPDFKEVLTRAAWRAGLLGAINVVVRILAVRLILLLAVLGAVFLAWLSLPTHEPMQLAVLGIYVAGVTIPLVWLSSRRD